MNTQLDSDTGTLISILDLMLDDDDQKDLPKFILMMNMLNSKVSKNLITQKHEIDFKNAKSNLLVARWKYLQNVVLYETVKSIHYKLYAHSLNADAAANGKILLHKNLQDFMNYVEMKQSLSCLQLNSLGYQRCESNLFGIKLEKITKPQWAHGNFEALKEMVLKIFIKNSTHLGTFYRELFNLSKPAYKTNELDPVVNLITACEEIPLHLEELRRKKKYLQRDRVKLQLLLEGSKKDLEMLSDKTFRLGQMQLEEKDDLLKVELLQSRSLHSSTALRLFQLKVFQDIYTPNIIADHNNMNLNLDDHKHKIRYQIIKAKQQLHVYKTLGPQFESLVEEYATLLMKMESIRRLLYKQDA